MRYEVGNNDMSIVTYRAVGCMMMMMSVMKNNNLFYEYAANSATTTINHYTVYCNQYGERN